MIIRDDFDICSKRESKASVVPEVQQDANQSLKQEIAKIRNN